MSPARHQHPRGTSVGFAAGLATAGLVTALLAGGALTGAAAAASTEDPARVGLYGGQDPTFDGAYRQSLALLALTASGQSPDLAAVGWLLDQQCADGGWQAFRPDTDAPCTAPDSTSFAGEDTNSTGLAVQALVALGEEAAAADGLAWLVDHQGDDGGWAYYPDGAPGNPSDANSTALAWSAFSAAGMPPPTAGSGANPAQALLELQVGCPGAVDERGAFTFFGSANDFATVQSTLAAAGGSLPVPASTPADDAPALECPPSGPVASPDAAAAAGYLVRRLAANDGVIPDAFTPGATDFGTTANAVLALAATGHGASAAATALARLADDVDAFAVKAGVDVPGSLALLALAAVSLGADPGDFGGTDLVTRLATTITTSSAGPTPRPSVSPSVSPSVARGRGRLCRRAAGHRSGRHDGHGRARPRPRRRRGGPAGALATSVRGAWIGMTWRRVLATGLLPAAALAAVVCGAGPASAAPYRYWSYWHGSTAGWSFSPVGASLRPDDGSVEGWRFAVSPATGSRTPPRASPGFAAVCGGTAPMDGHKRVALVVDYGTSADAPAGQRPPRGVDTYCAVVPTAGTGYQVLAAYAAVRAEGGLVCAISGYPVGECGAVVAPGPTPSASARPTATARPAPTPPPSSTRRPATPAATASGSAVAVPSTATPGRSPAPTGTAAGEVQAAGDSPAPVAVAAGGLPPAGSGSSGGLPLGAVAGGTAAALLAAAALRRYRRAT